MDSDMTHSDGDSDATQSTNEQQRTYRSLPCSDSSHLVDSTSSETSSSDEDTTNGTDGSVAAEEGFLYYGTVTDGVVEWIPLGYIDERSSAQSDPMSEIWEERR